MKRRSNIAAGILIFLAVALSSLALILGHNSPCGPAPAVSSETELMNAIVYRCYGSPDVLELAGIKKPVPADDEVLIQVHAAAVNPYDWHFMRGSPYFMRLMLGLGAPKNPRLGVDFAGTIEVVGQNVKRFRPGDEVFGGTNGAFAEYVTVRGGGALALKPANMTFEQAAGVPIAGVTALQALRDTGKIRPGKKVLINGASGGVGTFAVQIAKSFGAEVTGVCSTRNMDMVRSIGADHVIDYTREDYTRSGRHYDLIIDNVGNHSPLANARVLGPGGIVILIGGAKGNWLGPLMNPIKAFLLSPFMDQKFEMMIAELRSDDLAVLADLMRAGTLTPVIDRRYRLNELPAAIRYSEQGHARGKIVIDLR